MTLKVEVFSRWRLDRQLSYNKSSCRPTHKTLEAVRTSSLHARVVPHRIKEKRWTRRIRPVIIQLTV